MSNRFGSSVNNQQVFFGKIFKIRFEFFPESRVLGFLVMLSDSAIELLMIVVCVGDIQLSWVSNLQLSLSI